MTTGQSLHYREIPMEEKEAFARWLAADVWDNFGNPKISVETALERIEQGLFHGEDKRTFWIYAVGDEPVGLVQVYDLLDSTAMFDLRVNTNFRGQGIGRQALRWLTDFVFENYPEVDRIEANTRQDNKAMRRVLRACGYAKEGHFRAGWESGKHPSDWVDAVAYAILRYDWTHHTTTPVRWDDEDPLTS